MTTYRVALMPDIPSVASPSSDACLVPRVYAVDGDAIRRFPETEEEARLVAALLNAHECEKLADSDRCRSASVPDSPSDAAGRGRA